MKRRALRLDWMAGLGLALSLSFWPSTATAQSAAAQTATRTDLTVNASGQASVTVTDLNDDSPVGGIVSFEENGRILAQAVLNAQGQASVNLTLTSGDNTLQAVYIGDTTHRASVSTLASVQPQDTGTGATPGFQLSLTPVSPASLPMTLTAGQSGSLTVTVTPVDNAALTSPMFVTLSCSGLPSLSSCSFTPENVEITATTPTSCATGSLASACPPTSLMVISTEAQNSNSKLTPVPRHGNPVAWALLLPGILGLGGIAWGARRRRWLQRLTLVALIGLVTTLGTTACSPLYSYYHHGPSATSATPSGNYTVTITAQSSNGVTSISSSTTMVLTVK